MHPWSGAAEPQPATNPAPTMASPRPPAKANCELRMKRYLRSSAIVAETNVEVVRRKGRV
jgi:hypothetical protein